VLTLIAFNSVVDSLPRLGLYVKGVVLLLSIYSVLLLVVDDVFENGIKLMLLLLSLASVVIIDEPLTALSSCVCTFDVNDVKYDVLIFPQVRLAQ
jgi:hypothetical protein